MRLASPCWAAMRSRRIPQEPAGAEAAEAFVGTDRRRISEEQLALPTSEAEGAKQQKCSCAIPCTQACEVAPAVRGEAPVPAHPVVQTSYPPRGHQMFRIQSCCR